jgi:CRP-like cAMP-binding protein
LLLPTVNSVANSKYSSWSNYLALREDEYHRLLRALWEAGVTTVNRSYSRGSLVYQENEQGRGFCILTKGIVKLLSNYSGNRQFARLLGPWNILGPSIHAGIPSRRGCIQAYADCEIAAVSKASLEQAIQSRPEIALKLVMLQELRLIQYQELVKCLLDRRTEVRLTNLFSILIQEFGAHCPYGHLTLELQLTHQVLAEMVAATRESVTATMRGLRERKIVQMDRRGIVILDPERLTRIVSQ